MGFQHAIKVSTYIVILWNERECKRPEKSVVFKNEGIYGEGSACIGAIRVQFLEKISNVEGFAKHAEILTALVCGGEDDCVLKSRDGGMSRRGKRGDGGRVCGMGVSGKVNGSSS
jgi:hypothetical protein